MNKKKRTNEEKRTEFVAVVVFLCAICGILLAAFVDWMTDEKIQADPFKVWTDCATIITEKGTWSDVKIFKDEKGETIVARQKTYKTDDYILQYTLNEKEKTVFESIDCINAKNDRFLFQMRCIIDKVKQERRLNANIINYYDAQNIIEKLK